MIITRTKNAYLSILFPEHQEDIEAPFELKCEEGFYLVKGMQENLEVEMILPSDIGCYFEIRTLPTSITEKN